MDIKDGLSTLATIEVLSEKKFEKWYIFNRLPDQLKNIIAPSYKKFCKEQWLLQTINFIIPLLCTWLVYILSLKNVDSESVFALYLSIWFFSWMTIFLLTIGTHNIININAPYTICHKWIKKNAIRTVISLPNGEKKEKELLNQLEKEINKKR
jgi:succinate dehydrogenase hydrophobic anchor subunit